MSIAVAAVAAVAAVSVTGGGSALAASGGSGGAGVAPAPVISAVRCLPVAQHPCADAAFVQPGGTIGIGGRHLASAARVVFYGRPGAADDADAHARPRRRGRASQLVATVPATAHSGPLAVETSTGGRSRRWSGLAIDDGADAPPLPSQAGPEPAIGTAISQPRKFFYGGLRRAAFSYRVASSRPVDVDVNLVRVSDGTVVRSWHQPQVAPGSVQRVIWDGKANGRPQPEGTYTFTAAVRGASGAVASGPSAGAGDSFAFYGHMFPVRGKHDFGEAGARFGATRHGHTHQGQDVFARCGTPLAAARAGSVVVKGYHGDAGYYLVVSGNGSGLTYVYMHLRGAALVSKGDRVYTGQPIGAVGDSGNAAGCHLHFELWSAPGWYKGGSPLDPLSQLQRWDAIS